MKTHLAHVLSRRSCTRQANGAGDLEEAMQPLLNGVPQVAVVRLRELLQQDLSAEEKQTALLKLAEALIASGQPNESLPVLDDPAVRETPEAKFFRAQALAALSRWERSAASLRGAGCEHERAISHRSHAGPGRFFARARTNR